MSNDSGLGSEGSGNPDTDRAYLIAQPPTQVRDDGADDDGADEGDATQSGGDEPGFDAAAARD